MEYTITKRIGSKAHHFKVSGNNLFEVVTEANKLSFPDVPCCGLCGNPDIELQSRKAQGKFKYTFIKCYRCGGELTFGQKQEEPDVFYLRKNDHGQFDWKPPVQKEQ